MNAAERARAYRARKRAAGFRLVHGRWTDAPHVGRRPSPAEHGDIRRYWRGCHCAPCRAALAAYARTRYARRTNP